MKKETDIKVLVSDNISEKGVEILKKAELKVDVKTGMPPEELIKEIGKYDALVVRSATKVTADIIEHAKNLKVIGRAGSGLDNVDKVVATKRGIVVMNTSGGNTVTTAEHTMALLFSMARQIPGSCIRRGRIRGLVAAAGGGQAAPGPAAAGGCRPPALRLDLPQPLPGPRRRVAMIAGWIHPGGDWGDVVSGEWRLSAFGHDWAMRGGNVSRTNNFHNVVFPAMLPDGKTTAWRQAIYREASGGAPGAPGTVHLQMRLPGKGDKPDQVIGSRSFLADFSGACGAPVLVVLSDRLPAAPPPPAKDDDPSKIDDLGGKEDQGPRPPQGRRRSGCQPTLRRLSVRCRPCSRCAWNWPIAPGCGERRDTCWRTIITVGSTVRWAKTCNTWPGTATDGCWR